MSSRKIEGEELEYPFFEGDGSSFNEWGDYGMSSDDYEGPPIFDVDPYEEEIVSGDVRKRFVGNYVGRVKDEIHPNEQDEVSQVLLEQFKCVPTFISELFTRFYHGFCKQHLWPLFRYMLPMTHDPGGRFNRSLWQAYVSVNKIFGDGIIEVINLEEYYVWIHDYHLMVLPIFLRKRSNRVKLGFFLHSPFPSSEIYKMLPDQDEFLRALLNSDHIGFHTFDYARHFLSCCSRLLGISYESKRLEYYGRTVAITILHVGIDMHRLHSVLNLPRTESKVTDLIEQFRGKTMLLGVDDLDFFKGISLKLLAMEHVLIQHLEWQGKVVLVQMVNPVRGIGKDVKEVKVKLIGTTDPTGTFNSDEVCIVYEDGQISVNVLAYKNLGLHFGDVHVLNARYVKKLQDYFGYTSKFGIFFSTKDRRSVANEITCGGFFGDLYWVSKNHGLLSDFKPRELGTHIYSTPNAISKKPSDLSYEEKEYELRKRFFSSDTNSNSAGIASNNCMAFTDRHLILPDDDTTYEKELLFTTSSGLLDCRTFGLDILIPIARSSPTLIITTGESFIGLWDDCINRVISNFSNTDMVFSRKLSLSKSEIQDQWLNVTVFARNFCLSRGEETDRLRKDNNLDPSSLMIQKLLWSYMDLSYLSGYYVVGYIVTFCASSRTHNRIIRTDLHIVDLSTSRDQIKALVPCWSIDGLLSLLADHCADIQQIIKSLPYSDFETIDLANNNIIYLTSNYMPRVFLSKKKWFMVKEIYDSLDHRISHSEFIFQSSKNDPTLSFKPRGCKLKLSNFQHKFDRLLKNFYGVEGMKTRFFLNVLRLCDFEIEKTSVKDCGDPFLEATCFSEDVTAIYKKDDENTKETTLVNEFGLSSPNKDKEVENMPTNENFLKKHVDTSGCDKRVPHVHFYAYESGQKVLNMLKPSEVVVHKVENTSKRVKVYFIFYEDSTEVRKFEASICFENEVFESPIRKKINDDIQVDQVAHGG